MKRTFDPYFETNGNTLNLASRSNIENPIKKQKQVRLAVFSVHFKYSSRGDHREELKHPKTVDAIITENGQIRIQGNSENYRQLIEFNHTHRLQDIIIDFEVVDDGRVFV